MAKTSSKVRLGQHSSFHIVDQGRINNHGVHPLFRWPPFLCDSPKTDEERICGSSVFVTGDWRTSGVKPEESSQQRSMPSKIWPTHRPPLPPDGNLWYPRIHTESPITVLLSLLTVSWKILCRGEVSIYADDRLLAGPSSFLVFGFYLGYLTSCLFPSDGLVHYHPRFFV
jgi:hypothetical protein